LVGLAVHQYLSRLGTTLQAESRRGEKLALVSDVSGALTGPHPPADIATRFLQKIRKVVQEGASTAVFVYDEAAEGLTSLAAEGPLAADLQTATTPNAVLPEPIRPPILKGRPVVVYDVLVDIASVGGVDAWGPLCRQVPALRQSRTFVMLPLMSRNRL